MAIWWAGPTAPDNGAGTSSGSPFSLNRAFGNAGTPAPVAGDTVRLLPGRYTGARSMGVSSSGAKIRFINDQEADVIIDGASTAVAGGGVTALTGWTKAGGGSGVLDYGGGYNSGSSWPYVYQLNISGVKGLWADDYVAGPTGTVKAPGSDNWWWVGLGDMNLNMTDNRNSQKRIHGVVNGIPTDGNGQESSGSHSDYSGYKGRDENAHDWRAQFINVTSPLYARFHTTGDMTGGSPAHTVYASTSTSPAIAATGKSNIVFDGGPNRRIKFYRWRRAFNLDSCNGWEILNCEMRWMRADGVYAWGCSNILIDNCLIKGGDVWEHTYGNVMLENCTNLEVKRCDLAHGQHQGICLKGSCSGGWIHDNVIHHQFGYGIYYEGPCLNILAEHNVIHDNGYIDRMLIHKTPHGGFDILLRASGCIFRRNEVLRCGIGFWKGQHGFDNCQIYNNTFHKCEYAGFFIDESEPSESGHTNANIFQNNLISETVGYVGTGGFDPMAIYYALHNAASNANWNNQFRNNLGYTPAALGGGTLQCRIASYAAPTYGFVNHTMEALQGSGGNPVPSWFWGSGRGSGNVAGNPVMEAPDTGDFDIVGASAALNAGSTSGLTLTPTILGAARPDYPAATGVIDIGAREGTSGGGGGGGTNQAPSFPSLTATPSGGAAPVTISFAATASDDITAASALAWGWNFGDPNSGANNVASGTGTAFASRTHLFEHPGAYTITATVTDAGGLSTSRTVVVVINSSRGGTRITSAAGFVFTPFGGGTLATASQTADKIMDQRWQSSSPPGDINQNTWSQNGLPGTPQGVRVDFGSAKTITRIQTGFHKHDLGRVVTYDLAWSNEGNANPGAWTTIKNNWLSMTGPGNEFSEIDLTAALTARHLRWTLDSNSDASAYATIWEALIYETLGGGGSPVARIPLVTALDWSGRDHNSVGFFGPAEAMDLVGMQSAVRHFSRWRGYPVVEQPWVQFGFGGTFALKTIRLAHFNAVIGRLYTYDILTAPAAGTPWTVRVSNYTNTAQRVTEHVLGAAASCDFVRIHYKGVSFGKVAELGEIECYT